MLNVGEASVKRARVVIDNGDPQSGESPCSSAAAMIFERLLQDSTI
jgi:hypothetical protein